MSRVEEMLGMWEAGESMADIGRTFGITRERVRQLLNRDFPDRERDELEPEDQELAELIRRADRAVKGNLRCVVCDSWILTTRQAVMRTCGSEHCLGEWRNQRYKYDAETRRKHRIYKARWIIKNPDKVPPSDLADAKRVLAGVR